MKKRNLFSWAPVIISVLALTLATLIGCESGLGGDAVPNNAAALQTLRKVVDPPATLEGTDWEGATGLGAEPYFAVFNFADEDTVNIIGSDITVTEGIYSYDASAGTGTVSTDEASADFSVDDTTLTITGGTLYPEDATFALLQPASSAISGTVWDTTTPRNIYSSIDFLGDTKGSTVQTTFGDGTFPAYDLDYYDGVGAGLIANMGLFYIQNNGATDQVIFPDFYQYHMTTPVIYSPTYTILPGLDGTTWTATVGGKTETVSFNANNATFSNGTAFTAPYVYNGRAAGGVDPDSSTPPNAAGSFQVIAGQPLTLEFYNFLGGGDVIFSYYPMKE